jgi:hypothetical protein
MLSEPSPMTHLCGALFGPPPWGITLDWITEGQDGQEMQWFGDPQQLFDAIPVHAADPAGANPFIPARQLHILHRPRAIDFMPVVGGVSDHGYGTARLFDEASGGAQGAELLQHGVILDRYEMPGLQIARTGGETPCLHDVADRLLGDVCRQEGAGGAPRADALESIHGHLPAIGLVPCAAISPLPEPSPLEGEGWEGSRVTGGVFMALGT